MTQLSDLHSFGPASQHWLNTIGIYTLSDLEKIGAVEAYRQLKQLGFPVSLNLVYAIEGAILNTPWNHLPPDIRQRLKKQVQQLNLQPDTQPETPLQLPFTVDAHLDLAYNALKFNRDALSPVRKLRQQEADSPSPNGIATVSIPDLLEAGVGMVFATIFVMPAHSPHKFTYHAPTTYHDTHQAHFKGMAQLDYYYRLTDRAPHIRLVTNRNILKEVVQSHSPENSVNQPLFGIVIHMEGADPIRQPEELEMWYERGLRSIGLAWDDTQYAAGAWRDQGGLTPAGYRLLDQMASYGMILDVTHASEKASLEAIERYEGTVVATHCNARTLVPGSRQLSDHQIRLIGERGGVIGAVLFNSFLRKEYLLGDGKERVTLDHVVAHIDHICQLLGSSQYVGIGSDLDGGFGAADIPLEIDNVADLPKIGFALREKGYSEADVAGIMGGNWLRLLDRALP